MYKKTGYLFIFLSILMTAFIFYQSMNTAAESSEKSSVITGIITMLFKNVPENLTYLVRKTAHVLEFFLQSLCICVSFACFSKKYSKQILNILFIGLMTAVTDEFIQSFFDGRSAEVKDVFFDFGGTLLGVIFSIIVFVIINKSKKIFNI